jgi:phosphotransferase system HPr (HPr) family protein
MSDPSVRRATVTVRLPEGLHLRPLTQLSKLAQTFSAAITLRKGGQAADAKRPLELMTLAAMCGEPLEVEASGSDADAALAAVVRLFESDFADGAA